MPNPFAPLSNHAKLHLLIHGVWLFWRAVYSFGLLVLLCAGQSIAAPPPPALVCVNADASKIGMSYVSELRTWEQLAGLLKDYRGVHLKHPCGIWKENSPQMVIDQGSRLAAYAAEHPDDKTIQARADMAAFARAWSNRPAKQFLSIYVGGSLSVPELADETPQRWAERMYAELAWARAACPDAIIFDNDYARNDTTTYHKYKIVNGPQGGRQRLYRMLRRDGIEVGIEPASATNIDRDADLWNLFSDDLAVKAQAAGGWEKYQQGKFRDPHKAQRMFFEVRTNGWTDAQKLAAIKDSQARGEIPVVFWGQVTPAVTEALK